MQLLSRESMRFVLLCNLCNRKESKSASHSWCLWQAAQNIQKSFAILPMKRQKSSFLESGLGPIICLGHWDRSKPDTIRELASACAQGLALACWVGPFCYHGNKPGQPAREGDFMCRGSQPKESRDIDTLFKKIIILWDGLYVATCNNCSASNKKIIIVIAHYHHPQSK